MLAELTPSGNAFDHAIVRVATPSGKTYWVDATIALQGGGLDPLRYAPYEHALVLGGATKGLDTLTSAPSDLASPSIRDNYVVPSPTSPAEAKLHSVRQYQGTYADAMRSQLRGKTTEEITKYFLATYQGDFPGVHEAGALEQQDDREPNVLRVVIHLAIPRFWTLDEQQGRYAAHVAARVMEGALSRPPTAKRAAPLGVPYPLRMESRIELDLPFDLDITPEQLRANDRAFELLFTSSYATRHLSYSYVLTTQAPVVDVADVDAHLLQVDKARGALARSLTYRTPTADGFNWAAFVALLGAVPFVCWGSYRAYRYEPRGGKLPFASPVEPGFERLGGWLLLLAIGMVVNPCWTLVALVGSARAAFSLATWRALTTPELASYAPGLAVGTIVEVVFLAGFVAYGIAVASLFFQRRRSFPFHFTIYAVSTAVFAVLDHLAARGLAAHPHAATTDTSVTSIIKAIASATIWVTYVHNSRRVTATFVTRAPRRRRVRPPERESE